MTETNLSIQRLLEANPLREPVLRSVIQTVRLPAGSHGIDVGCGIGLQALLLAEAVGSAGHVTGVDVAPELLAFAQNMVEEAGFSGRITFREGDAGELPFGIDSVEWAWSSDCIGYPAGNLLPTLAELVRVVKPGGSIIILGWSSQQVLPGYPLLEARLNATCSSYLPFLQDKEPEEHFLRMMHGFRKIGLKEVEAKTFVGDVQAPLGPGERAALGSLFEMLWTESGTRPKHQDWIEFQRLCKPGSADFIADLPDYYAFFTYTVFRGKVPLE